jgi:hypothetical protein
VTEAEYLIFKLLQLQKVDEELLGRLQTRFDELDTDGQDGLNVGTDIPSSDQVLLSCPCLEFVPFSL